MWSGLVTVPGVDIFALQNWFFMRLLLPGMARRAWYVSRLFLKQPFFSPIQKRRPRMGCGMWQGDVISHLTVIFCCGEKVITERRRSKGGVCVCFRTFRGLTYKPKGTWTVWYHRALCKGQFWRKVHCKNALAVDIVLWLTSAGGVKHKNGEKVESRMCLCSYVISKPVTKLINITRVGKTWLVLVDIRIMRGALMNAVLKVVHVETVTSIKRIHSSDIIRILFSSNSLFNSLIYNYSRS